MIDKIFKTSELIYDWLSSIAVTYRGVLPAGEKPAEEYLKYSGYYDGFAGQFILPIQIYTLRQTSYKRVLFLADKIEKKVGEAGVLIGDSNIKIKIQKGSPFYQDMADEDETVRAGYVNLLITIYG